MPGVPAGVPIAVNVSGSCDRAFMLFNVWTKVRGDTGWEKHAWKKNRDIVSAVWTRRGTLTYDYTRAGHRDARTFLRGTSINLFASRQLERRFCCTRRALEK